MEPTSTQPFEESNSDLKHLSEQEMKEENLHQDPTSSPEQNSKLLEFIGTSLTPEEDSYEQGWNFDKALQVSVGELFLNMSPSLPKNVLHLNYTWKNKLRNDVKVDHVDVLQVMVVGDEIVTFLAMKNKVPGLSSVQIY